MEKCWTCKNNFDDTDLKTICFECRACFLNEVKQVSSSGKNEDVKKLILSVPLDDKWRKNMLNRLSSAFNQFIQQKEHEIWKKNTEIRIQKEEEVRKQERIKKIEEERQELEKKQQEARINHQKRLVFLGLNYLGVSAKVFGKKHRTPFCWNCKKPLDNDIDEECNVCGWILCHCGACGCGYEDNVL